MILKILLVALVIGIVYFIFIKKKPLQAKKNNDTKQNKKDTPQSSEMVACTTCGIYAELAETIISNNKYYCSSECVEKA